MLKSVPPSEQNMDKGKKEKAEERRAATRAGTVSGALTKGEGGPYISLYT